MCERGARVESDRRLHLDFFFSSTHSPLSLSPCQPHAAALAARLRDSPSVPAFLVELQALAGRAMGEATGPSASPSSRLATAARAVEAAGPAAWTALSGVSPCGARLEFQQADGAGRVHTLRVRLGGGGGGEEARRRGGAGSTAAALAADLPANALPPAWADHAASAGTPLLAAALAAWQSTLAACADLWACLDDLDARFRVLDPAPPTRADTHRVLALTAGGASLEVALSPAAPRAPPCVTAFMGAPAAVEGPRAALRAFVEGGRWDGSALPGDNLLAAGVGILPSAGAAAAVGATVTTANEPATAAVGAGGDEEPTGAECAICYAYHLPAEGEMDAGAPGAATPAPATVALPSIHCPHPRCGRPYHAACLRGWLASLPGARAALGRLTGECPYCGEEVGVEV